MPAVVKAAWGALAYNMERNGQRYAGLVVAETLHLLKSAIESGERNTLTLNNMAEDYMLKRNVYPACKGYRPAFHAKAYEYAICLSVNHEIVHGIPRADKNLKNGDIVGIDIVGLFEGWHADAAITVPVGEVSNQARKLIKWTESALIRGIKQVKLGGTTGDIGFAIQNHAKKKGLGVAKYLAGHGIGHEIHCAPSIPNIGKSSTGAVLEGDISLCIEPMLTLGSDATHVHDDTWTIVTSDGSLAAHFEHTVLLKKNGELEILTKLPV